MMTITTTAFGDGQEMPSEYTCDGTEILPTLAIAGVPESAKSLAIIMDDPDSKPTTWTHWTIWNIPADTTEIANKKLPEGSLEGNTSFEKIGYGGPCPGVGKHRYFFKLYALDVVLNILAGADIDTLMQAISGHVLEQAQVMGTYERGSV
ncbi:MAG: YbhB/YbcL family Raf kinase inhibitor-like protein [Candidatus Andersenbacteria bacterium]